LRLSRGGFPRSQCRWAAAGSPLCHGLYVATGHVITLGKCDPVTFCLSALKVGTTHGLALRGRAIVASRSFKPRHRVEG